MTLFVNRVVAFFALVPLHAQPPQEFVAKGTKGGLTEKLGDKLVAFKRVDLEEWEKLE